MILVEPEGGLPKVDREFYVMQGEIYTRQKLGSKGELTESYDRLMAERRVLFNGAALALAKDKPLKAKTGRRSASSSASAVRTIPRPST